MTEKEALRELALAAARIVVLEAEALALRQEAKRLKARVDEEFLYSEALLRQVHPYRTDMEVSIRLEEVVEAIRKQTVAVDTILEFVMREREMEKEE